MRNIIDMTKEEFLYKMPENGVYVDMFTESGFETLSLATHAKTGRVYTFGFGGNLDIACKVFASYDKNNISVINDTADHINTYISGGLDGAILRVPERCPLTTDKMLSAVEEVLYKLNRGGRLAFINNNSVYEHIANYLGKLSYREYFTMRIGSPNDVSGPKIIIVEKR